MATPKWAPGKLYPKGSLVVPRTSAPPVDTSITNSDFESGTTDWTLDADVTLHGSGGFSGANCLEFAGLTGERRATHATVPVSAGKKIVASAMYEQGAASAGHNPGQVILQWFDATDTLISESKGSVVSSGSGGAWFKTTVTATAPAAAASVSIGGLSTRTGPGNPSYFDHFVWDYAAAVPPTGLVYRAVQPAIGTSASVEPTWPTTLGVQVIDNTVIWEAVIATRITYEAVPILKSGPTEPTWPEEVGAAVADNTISWIASPRQATEAPNSKVVAITASKVFAADGDIIRYSATVNPLDWTTADDAGYLPSGLNQYGSNDTAVLNTYRSSLVSFSASTFQNWQVDPDPANMSLLDAMEGIGSTFQQSAQPVAKDLFYLTALGVRTVGISVGSTNLVNGDAGMPIDPLVREEVKNLGISGYIPRGLYYPSLGQYWIAFGETVYVYTFAQIGSIGAWSRYVFPWPIEGQAQIGNSLYLRSGNAVYRVDPERLADQKVFSSEGMNYFGDVEVVGEIQSHYLDFESPGVTKMMIGYDLVGTGTAAISIGYNQTNQAQMTTEIATPGDSVPGNINSMPISAPSFSMRLRYSSDDGAWEWLAANFYINDFRVTS